MHTTAKYLLFVSSVQREFAPERRELKDFVEADALLGRFFSVFLFEDIPASGRRPDEVYLDEVDRCAIYVGLFGNKYGTGTLMMIAETTACSLPEPDFEATPGEFIITLWRDWLTPDVVARFGLNERQALAIAYVKQHGRISNPDYQTLAKTTKKTATRDLSDLKTRGLLEQRGDRGPGVHYVLVQKRDIMGTLGTSKIGPIGSESAQSGHETPAKPSRKRDKKGTNGTSRRPENLT